MVHIIYWIFTVIGMGFTAFIILPESVSGIKNSRKSAKRNRLMGNIARLELETGMGLHIAEEWVNQQEKKIYTSPYDYNTTYTCILPECGKTFNSKRDHYHYKLCPTHAKMMRQAEEEEHGEDTFELIERLGKKLEYLSPPTVRLK